MLYLHTITVALVLLFANVEIRLFDLLADICHQICLLNVVRVQCARQSFPSEQTFLQGSSVKYPRIITVYAAKLNHLQTNICIMIHVLSHASETNLHQYLSARNVLLSANGDTRTCNSCPKTLRFHTFHDIHLQREIFVNVFLLFSLK